MKHHQYDLDGFPVKFPVFFLRWTLIPDPILKKCDYCNNMIQDTPRIFYCLDFKIKLFKKNQLSLDKF